MKTVTRAKGWIAAQVKSVLKSVNAQTADGAGNISLTTDNVPEGPTNKYFTIAGVRTVVLTGLDVTLAGAVVATDTILAAFGKLQKQLNAWIALKDASGGFAGLTLFQINFRNAANTFTSFFTNANTAARTYTFPDKDGTVAMLTDVVGGGSGSVVLVNKTVITNGTALLSLLNVFPAGIYDRFVVLFEGVALASADILWMGVGVNGASGGSSGSVPAFNSPTSSPQTQSVLTFGGSTGTSAKIYSGVVEFDALGAASAKTITWRGTRQDAGTNFWSDFNHMAFNASNVSGFRLFPSVGSNTFTGGTLLIYGIKNS